MGEPSLAQVTEAASASGKYAYAFDPTGLTSSIGDGTSAIAITRVNDRLNAGYDIYKFDSIGRVTAIDDETLTYGPDGQVARSTHGTKTTSYIYDEKGQRLLKTINGSPAAAYIDGKVVTPTELVEPVKMGGRMVGMLRNGAFTLAATDIRGTIEADTTGTQRLASPFGARPVHPDVAAAVDYAETSFDADLGTNRMGVRDYDPRIARFLQPDPAFLEHPEKCVMSPIECNLYGYALARPLDFTDPSGTSGRGLALGFGGSAILGDGFDGLGGAFEVGLVIDFSKGEVRAYSTGSWADDPRSFVLGASAGIGPAVTYIRDMDKFAGQGSALAVATPYASAQEPLSSSGHITDVRKTDDNGRGVSGKSLGASISYMPTDTRVSPPIVGAHSITESSPPPTPASNPVFTPSSSSPASPSLSGESSPAFTPSSSSTCSSANEI